MTSLPDVLQRQDWAGPRQESWTDYLPYRVMNPIRMNPLYQAVQGYMGRQSLPLELPKRDDEVPMPRRPGMLDNASPTTLDAIDKVGFLANFLGPGAKLPPRPAAPAPTQPGIKAYHGSPHDFDRFDMSKIGTGEGAQAYGRGLYFAESEGVARRYRDQLGNYDNNVKWRGQSKPTPTEQRLLDQLSGPDSRGQMMTVDKLRMELLRSEYDAREGMFPNPRRSAELKSQIAELDRIKGNIDVQPPGRMYEVKINADPEHFLDWDKPLGQQPENIRKLAQGLPETATGEQAYRALAERKRTGARSGDPLEDVLLDIPITDDAAAARRLKEAGVPGIKYLDQQSRGTGQGSRNYVVFDDAMVEILRKYGLLPPLAAGAATAATQGQDQPF